MRNSTIIRCGRALLTALQPFTGERASGTVRMRAAPGKQFLLPRFTYLFPVKTRTVHTAQPFKVGVGPEADGAWVIRDDRDTSVDVYSAVGGAKYNIPAGTVFAFDYIVEGLLAAPFAERDFVGGQNHQDDFGSLHDAVSYETFDGPAVALDVHRGNISHFPAAVIAFVDLIPADGVTTAQTTGGSVNAGTGSKFYKLNYAISVLTVRTEGDLSRRYQGALMVDEIMGALIDLHAANDGEAISNPGGIQIRQVLRESGQQDIYKKFYIYTILVSVMTAITRTPGLDTRKWAPWLRTKMDIDHPQSPVLENQGAIRVVDSVLMDMNVDTDIALDGTFTRGNTANFWDGLLLASYAVDERRLIGGRIFLEPAITNDLGDAALDFEEWTATPGVVVSPVLSSRNPLGYDSPPPYELDFPDGIEGAGIALDGITAAIGVPHIFYAFVRGAVATSDALTLIADDGVSTESRTVAVTTEWSVVRLEFIPSTTSVEFRIENGPDDEARTVDVWGAFFSVTARWGAEFTATTKAKDVLTFLPYGADDDPPDSNRTPYAVLKGKWGIRMMTCAHVPPDLTGTGLAMDPVLVSLNDGTTDLLLITLQGTPASGGAVFTLRTRGGNILSIDSVEWIPGDMLELFIDSRGELKLTGTTNADGTYTFPRYDLNANLIADRMVFGADASGLREAVPGFFSVVIGD